VLLIFLIADVRGYTSFTVQGGDEAAARLAQRFAEVAESVAGDYGGQVIELRGDEALAVFSSARDALQTAVALQSVFGEGGSHGFPLKVGIGLDAGEAIPVKGGYRGGALNLAARLCSLAQGGEVLCSETVVGLARKTEGLDFLDRGQVIPKGMRDPVRVFQVVPEGTVPDEASTFTVFTAPRPNLPVPSTPFIGREQEVEAIEALLRRQRVRMLTLTGPGGIGKTRLALRVAEELRPDFTDGVVYVALAPLTDPHLVRSSIATSLGIREVTNQSLLDTVAEYLQERHLLLVLDNFEHLLPAAPLLSDLISRCPRLTLLITSRAVLHLGAEYEYPVAPLPVPRLVDRADGQSLAENDAVSLFLERARAVKPGFTLTMENAAPIVEICARLDGLPLAIELAAARVRLFPPSSLLQRLSRSLTLLTGGARDAPVRQQTLRNTIDWSYELLTEEERQLFIRLGVFAGGWTYEAAEAVCGADGELDVLEGLTSLAEKSLVREEDVQAGSFEDARFFMLDTIREYANEKLGAADGAEAIRLRHAIYFSDLGEQAAQGFKGPEQKVWSDRMEMELDNIRAVLRWSSHDGNPLPGLRLAANLGMFWKDRAHLTEGRQWLEALLSRDTGTDKRARAHACDTLGMTTRWQGDFAQARVWMEESLQLYRSVGDWHSEAMVLSHLGGLARTEGDLVRATKVLEEALKVCRESGNLFYLSSALANLGEVRMRYGDYEQARRMLDEALVLREGFGDELSVAETYVVIGRVEHLRGDLIQAESWFRKSLGTLGAFGAWISIVDSIEGLAAVLADRGERTRAARLWGAATSVREASGLRPLPPTREEEWLAAWNQGRAVGREDAVAYALRQSAQE
jgi:predicted ATPase/class 3 adenylate cyclase/Tfp pilus assembly protein PilF